MRRLSSELNELLGLDTLVISIKIGDSSSEDKKLSFFDNVNRQVLH